MRLHYHQASRIPSMTTDRPPFPMAHTDPGIGPNISKCVGVVCERSNLRITQHHLQNNRKIPRQIQQVHHMSSTLGFNDTIYF